MDQNSAPLTPSNSAIPEFDPVSLTHREDGWTPDRQLGFIDALAECGCVTDAARRVGMSKQSAYALRARPEAKAFRLAWRVASEHGARALGDAAWSRALHGVTNPVFYKGEQIGERTVFNEQLTMFMLRHLDPARFGKWIERAHHADEHPDPGLLLLKTRNLLCDHAHGVMTTLADHRLAESNKDEDDDEAKDDAISYKSEVGSICDDNDQAGEADNADQVSEGSPDAILPGAYPSTSSTLNNLRDDPEWCAMREENSRRHAAERRATEAAERARLPRIRTFALAHLPPWM